MALEGTVEPLELGEVFRLLKINGESGMLEVVRGLTRAYFLLTDGLVYFADSSIDSPGLEERFVREGVPRYLIRDLKGKAESGDPLAWVVLLLHEEHQSRQAVNETLSRHIEATAFSVFMWEKITYRFVPGPAGPGDQVLVLLDFDALALEAARRVDDWRLMMDSIGSLERVPHLTRASADSVALKSAEWEMACFADGRRDINTIIKETKLERFQVVKTIWGLLRNGLMAVRDPTLELLGQTTAVALKGPIDVYTLTFLITASTGEVSSHLRVEMIEEEEQEIHLSAGVREINPDESCLIYFADARTPAWVVKRMAMETSAFILLVNVNSRDSVGVSCEDVELMEEIGDRPYIAVTYASLEEEKMTEDEVREILHLPARVPMFRCGLRNPEDVTAVMDALLSLVP